MMMEEVRLPASDKPITVLSPGAGDLTHKIYYIRVTESSCGQLLRDYHVTHENAHACVICCQMAR